MQTGILHHLLNLLGDPLGTLRTLAQKGLGALRSLFGGARGLFRSVIKRVTSFVMSKVMPAAASARDTMGNALESLKRRVQAVMDGKAPPPEDEADEPEPAAEKTVEVPVVEVQRTEVAAETIPEPAVAPRAEGAQATQSAESRPSVLSANTYRNPESAEIVALAPVLGRALVRALGRRRGPSQARCAHA